MWNIFASAKVRIEDGTSVDRSDQGEKGTHVHVIMVAVRSRSPKAFSSMVRYGTPQPRNRPPPRVLLFEAQVFNLHEKVFLRRAFVVAV